MMRLRSCFLAFIVGCAGCTATAADIDNANANDNTSFGESNTACLASEFTAWINSDDVQRWLHDYNQATSLQQVKERDANWAQFNDNDKIIQAVLQHPGAAALRALQNHYSVLGESFLMGANGGLVAATQRTTDYWQGDEPQYLDTVALPPGGFKLIKPSADESSHAILAKMTMPIYDQHDGNDKTPIGVLVLGFDQMVVDFERPCSP